MDVEYWTFFRVRLLFISNLFPDTSEPYRGLDNATLLHALADRWEIRTLALRPMLPWRRGKWRQRTEDAALNPQFVRTLREDELLFVLAHEVFHLALRTHDRAVGSDPLRFNFAHDYIINDILRTELQVQTIPAGGLDWPGARLLSAEEILLDMEKNPRNGPAQSQVWQGPSCPAGKPGASCRCPRRASPARSASTRSSSSRPGRTARA